ncbi:MAG TPA: glycoside hydrolase family 38 C-terminal domain-containing protein, partial [Acidimicrobiales bacterium]|nr:glycoside hydrolase family 38 C-terminal domain-containing protein [Acidimicrobiales bacterium]
RNSAHDSVCACSADPVVRAVVARYDTARALAAGVTASAVSIAEVATRASGPMIVNPLPFETGGVVELVLPGDVAPAGVQQMSVHPAAVEERAGRGRDLASMLGQLAADGWLGPTGRGVGADLSANGPLVVTIHSDASRKADPAMASVMAEAWAQAGAAPDEPLTVRVVRAAGQRVVTRVEPVPGWGWAMWEPAAAGAPRVTVAETYAGVSVTNGLLHVDLDRGAGTFALDGVAGHNGLVEEDDDGDTYNFSPADRPPVTAPDSVAVEVIEAGPVRAVIRVRRHYPWSGADGALSDIEVAAGEAGVRITTSFDHVGRDHRIRAVFPLGRRTDRTEAECAFATVVRTGAEGGPHEPALATFPSRRFVTAGSTTLTHQGLLEYELVDGTVLALTLLRATGILSRPAPRARPNVAGPPVPLRDAQMPGPQTFRYAVARGCADPWELADRMWTPLVPVTAGGHGHLPERGRRLAVDLGGARVSALRRREGAVEMRVFNPRPEPARVVVDGHEGTLVDLTGATTRRWVGRFELRPFEFVTARLAATSLD